MDRTRRKLTQVKDQLIRDKNGVSGQNDYETGFTSGVWHAVTVVESHLDPKAAELRSRLKRLQQHICALDDPEDEEISRSALAAYAEIDAIAALALRKEGDA